MTVRDIVLQALRESRGGITRNVIADTFGLNRCTTKKALMELREEGLAGMVGFGVTATWCNPRELADVQAKLIDRAEFVHEQQLARKRQAQREYRERKIAAGLLPAPKFRRPTRVKAPPVEPAPRPKRVKRFASVWHYAEALQGITGEVRTC